MMTEKEFRALYEVTFMATMKAKRWEELQSRGRFDAIKDHGFEAEEALTLSEYAWKYYQESLKDRNS